MNEIYLASKRKEAILWKQKPDDIYIEPFIYFIGLYSRHGYFYPPYNIIPDINYKEFVQNFYNYSVL